MPLIDPNYLRQAAMARVNQGLLPAVGDEDYAVMLERLRQDYGIDPTEQADGGEVGNILDTQPTDASGLIGQDSLDQGAMDKVNVGMLPAVPMMGRGPRPPGAEPERQFLMEDKWQPPVTDWQDQVKGVVDKLPPPLFSEGLIPGTNPIGMARGVAEQVAQLHDTGVEISRGQQITHPALAAFNAITMAPIPGARIAKEAEQVTQTAKPFFSMLRQAVEAAPFSKAPGKQWLGRVQNTPGVKLDELDWTGFRKWAEATPLATKEEALAHLDENAIDVQEVVKGEQPDWKTLKQEQDEASRAYFAGEQGGGERLDAANAALDAATTQATEGNTKFSQWQLPGGENYREMLLTLPSKLDETARRDLLSGRREAKHFPNDFVSGHYDEPNVLAHMRFNDRVDANGKKTLFIEEIQSDWHQKGRKQGYQVKPLAGRVLPQGDGTFKVQWEDTTFSGGYHSEAAARAALEDRAIKKGSGVPDAPFKKDWHELALKRAIKYAADNGYDQIAWTPGAVQAERYDLSKHVDNISAVRGAKEGTYDFTAKLKQGGDIAKQGLTEAELADEIGKDMADKIVKDMHELKNNRWGVRNQQSGNWSPRFATKQEAEAYQRDLPEGTRTQTEVLPMTEKFSKIYRDLDLKVGGEGMKGFYDKMLPDAANKIGKKYGAKVGTTKIPEAKKVFGTKSYEQGTYRVEDQDVWTLPLTPQLKEQAIKKGFPVSALEDLTRAVG